MKEEKKVTNKERKAFYQRKQLTKYLSVLTSDEYKELQVKLDDIDATEDVEEKRIKELGLQIWLSKKYEEATRNLCTICANEKSCRRNKEKVRSCKLFEKKEGEENEFE